MIISIKLYLILRLFIWICDFLASPFWRQDVLAPSRFGANFYFLKTNYYKFLELVTLLLFNGLPHTSTVSL